MLDHTDQDTTHEGEADARAKALRDADYASLTRRAATDNSRALVDDVLRLITEEVPSVTQFREAFGKRFVQSRYDTRWRATAQLAELAAAHGISLLDIGRHF